MTNILIIYTGGTIGMMVDLKTGALMPFNFDQITENVPELKRLDCTLTVHSFNPPIDSSNMTETIWIELAELIEQKYHQFDGFVILHGTDTMAYTASALSFMLENLDKPVVFTGSQLPINDIRTDARENLITALNIAAAKQAGKATVPEVCIYCDYKLFRGNRSVKYNSAQFEAFSSPNYPTLADAGIHIKFNNDHILKTTGLPLKVHKKLDTAIGILKLYPGINPAFVHAILSADCKAIIMETFGSGNAPTQPWFLNALRSAINKGTLILNISQCKKGSVELGVYETSIYLQEMGVISGYDMTFEASISKLMYLLGSDKSKQAIIELLSTNLRGELTR